jgi:tetratricopeptide (TPR) repeat protein
LYLQKNQADVCNRLGHIFFLKDNLEEGLRWYEQAAKLAPENLRAGMGILEYYWRTGAYEKLPILARKILDNNPHPSHFRDALYFWAGK